MELHSWRWDAISWSVVRGWKMMARDSQGKRNPSKCKSKTLSYEANFTD